MESVSDHDYLNFDPKFGGVWQEESDVPLPVANTTGRDMDCQSTNISEKVSAHGKVDNDDSDGECDYENVKNFMEDIDYMNIGEVLELDPAHTSLAASSGSSHSSPFESRKKDGKEGQADIGATTTAMTRDTSESRTPALPKVSPKPTKKTNPPPPLILPSSSSEMPSQPPLSVPSPSSSSSTDSSSLPPPSAKEFSATSSQPSPRLKKPKPAAPIRKSSLYNNDPSNPLPEPTHDDQRSPSTSANPPKPQKPVGRSSSIRQRAKMLEMSMTSSSSTVSADDSEVSEDSATGQDLRQPDAAIPAFKTGNFTTTSLDLPTVPELVNRHVVEDSQVHTQSVASTAPVVVTTQEEASSNPNTNTEQRDMGTSSALSQLSHQAHRLAGMTSPSKASGIPKATFNTTSPRVQASAMASGDTSFSESNSSSSTDTQVTSDSQKRPRLTHIRNKLAQKKDASEASIIGNGQSISDADEAGSDVGGVLGSSSQSDSRIPAKRPNLATIKKRLKEKELVVLKRSDQTESELANVSPFNSINLPPVQAPATAPKRGSAPASSISSSISSERLKEWRTKAQRSDAGSELLSEVPPPVPKRTGATFQISSPPIDPVTRHKEYFNVLMKTKNESSPNAKPSSPNEHNSITPPSKDSSILSPRKQRNMTGTDTSDEVANQHRQPSPRTKTKPMKDDKDQTQKEQQTSPIKKAFVYLTVRSKDQTGTKKKPEVETQTRARFIKMANRPLPMLPGHSYEAGDEPDHTEKDYEEFGSNGGPTVESEYLNYPHLPTAVANTHSNNRWGRSHSQEPQLPALSTRSAPNSPMIVSRSQTLGRPGRSPAAAARQSIDSDGYINSDLLPEPLVSGIPLPHRAPIPVPLNASTGTTNKKNPKVRNEDSNDYDYPDLRLTGAFSTPGAQQRAISKLEQSKISAYEFQQPRKTQEVRSCGVGSKTSEDGIREDDASLRDRTWSTASSAYVPMANLYPNNDEDDDDYVPPSSIDIERFRISTSTLNDGGISSEVNEENEDVSQRPEDCNQSETVYVNLPTPKRVGSVVPPRAVTSSSMSLPPRKSSVEDNQTPSSSSNTKYPVVKPKPTKKRTATIAAILSAELNTSSPHDGWNKTGIDKESEDIVPPRNVPRESSV